MIEKVLMPTDGSDYALRAAEYAADLAKRYGAAVTVITVVEMVPSFGVGRLAEGEADIRAQLTRRGQEAIERTRAVFEKAGLTAEEEVVSGSAVSSILGYVRTGKYDLIVIGRRGAGTSAIDQILLGNVAEGILHEATVPVLLIPPA